MPDAAQMERALRHIVRTVASDRNAPEAAIYLADVAAVALDEADPTRHDLTTWLGAPAAASDKEQGSA